MCARRTALAGMVVRLCDGGDGWDPLAGRVATWVRYARTTSRTARRSGWAEDTEGVTPRPLSCFVLFRVNLSLLIEVSARV